MAAPVDHREFDKKVEKLKAAGLTNDDQIRLALQVYLDLCERKDWWNVSIEPMVGLNEAVVCGHSTATSSRQAVVVMKSSQSFTVRDLTEKVSTISKQLDCDGVTAALIGPDTTVTYNKMAVGLVPPDPPEHIEEKLKQKHRQFRRKQQRFVNLKSSTLSRTDQTEVPATGGLSVVDRKRKVKS